jgi:chloramphenicol 3-O phosphotransferase
MDPDLPATPSVPGRVVLLLGTVCAGKSTLARALQERSPTPLLNVSIDAFLAMVPRDWGAGRGGSVDGFRYEREEDAAGIVTIRIRYGDLGWTVLVGMHDAVAAMARAGLDVVVDDLPIDRAVLADWRRALRGVDVTVVLVHCAPEVAAQREHDREARRSVPGLARGHVDLDLPHDLAVDTGLLTPDDAALQVLTAFARPPEMA